jgi:broad specificity phosphatase PhoE
MAPAVPDQDSFGVAMYPQHRTKTIHIVRHGQGFHNVAGELDHASYLSWDYADASLTSLGWQQSEALHKHLDATGIKSRVELVVVSPLLRTLQTAAGVWGASSSSSPPDEPLLMVSGLGKFPHAAIAAPERLKFIANEFCREQNGVHPCDRRSNLSFYKKSFPHVDFSEVETDEDTWWSPTERETAQDMFTRARTFVRWLLDRPESRIAVVSHSSFIFHMCQLFGGDCSETVRNEVQQRFRNCEMRTVVISDRLATGDAAVASTDFAGGLHFNEAGGKKAADVPVEQIVAEDMSVPHSDSLSKQAQQPGAESEVSNGTL